jgi:mono/diheme cytochrome c family protein
MKTTIKMLTATVLMGVIGLAWTGCKSKPKTPDNSLIDDGGGRKPADFPELALDVFQPMDGGIALSPDEIKGRNTWNLWCGGNEQFWDRVAREALGLFDLLKTIDSRHRGERFKELGLINQPGFKQATKPDKYGLWIDEAVEGEPAGIDPAVYGRPTGVMGFRLFDNPDFKGDAVKQWDAEKYNSDPVYATQKGLVRPYRVGVSCGSCHIAFHPTRPPLDVNNPKWENLASAIGNQYISEGKVFAPNVKEGGFFWEMLKTQPRGTSDTSRIATDHVNNPNAINPIFELGARMDVAHDEEISGESLLIPGAKSPMKVAHILKDGADSIGVPGATIRVYINIGMYSQHWLQQHQALLGLTPQKPFSIKTAQENSVYWNATQEKVGNIAAFFSKLTSYRLADAPGGGEYITKDESVMKRGKLVFAEECATCHSSKQPKPGEDADKYFAGEVLKPDFLTNNFLSDERRYPITRIGTNAARAFGTNAARGHVWSWFSSETYKKLKSPGSIDYWNPYTEAQEKFAIPDGGRGYYRTPSLVSIWSSAPFLHNNALGKYTGDPSVAGRMAAFDDAAEKLLWPEKRAGKDSIWRTTQECQVTLNADYLPPLLKKALGHDIDPDGFFRLGNIPAGTPVNLLANLNTNLSHLELASLLIKVKRALLEIKVKGLTGEAAKEVLKRDVAPALLKASNCPDLVTDRGHIFGSDLEDADKRALIEYLKTL